MNDWKADFSGAGNRRRATGLHRLGLALAVVVTASAMASAGDWPTGSGTSAGART